MNGIYLQGGGAKGAFQAGVICALHDAGISFDVVAGTSIGAINGYYIYANDFAALKSSWMDVDESEFSYVKESDMVINNCGIIKRLSKLEVDRKSTHLKAYYVNYVDVIGVKLYENFDDVLKLSKEEALERIRYSALLPKPRGMKLDKSALEEFDRAHMVDRFKEDLIQGEYNGMSLDGGILNNHFLEPFIKEKVDKLYLIPFTPEYKVPEYISRAYSEDKLIVISPEIPFLPMDTLRFEPEFCKKQFCIGYKRGERWIQKNE